MREIWGGKEGWDGGIGKLGFKAEKVYTPQTEITPLQQLDRTSTGVFV